MSARGSTLRFLSFTFVMPRVGMRRRRVVCFQDCVAVKLLFLFSVGRSGRKRNANCSLQS
jgi:hypothetical protein